MDPPPTNRPQDFQWPTIDPPAAAKTPNNDRRTLTIAIAISVVVAAIVGLLIIHYP